jgi:hypothetical protein
VGPPPAGEHSDHIAAGDALFFDNPDIWKTRSHHRGPTLRALRARRGAGRRGVVNEVRSFSIVLPLTSTSRIGSS